MCKFPGHASSHSIFYIFPIKDQISKVQTLRFTNIKFEKKCSYIDEGDTYPWQSDAILFNLTVGSWLLGADQLAEYFGNYGQCLGRKLGRFY